MLRLTLLTSLILCFATAQAAEEKKAELPPVKPGWSLLPDEVPDAKYERLVNEDDKVKVVEVRERGQIKKVTVHLKNSVLPDYEILMRDGRNHPGTGGRQGPSSTVEGPIGTRVWSVTDF